MRRILGPLSLLALCGCGAAHTPETPPMTTAPRGGGVLGSELSPDNQAAFAAMANMPDGAAMDTYFGVKVYDPFRALENSESETTKIWERGQTTKFNAYMSAQKNRVQLEADAKALLDGGSIDAPSVRQGASGRRYFFRERQPGMRQPVYFWSEGPKAKPKVLIDVTKEGEMVSLDWTFPSPKGNLVAWGSSAGGSEDSVLRIRDVKTGKDIGETIDRTRHTQLAWLPDESGFVYSRYPAPGTVPAGEERFHAKLYMHKCGQSADSDELIFTPRAKTDVPWVTMSPDGRWLALAVHMGWDRNDVYLAETKHPSAWTPVREGKAFTYEVMARNDGLYMLTSEDAPRGKLIRRDYVASGANESTLVAEAEGTLVSAAFGSGFVALQYMENAVARVEVRGFDKGALSKVAPKIVASSGTLELSASEDGKEVFVDQATFVSPGSVIQVSPKASSTWRALKLPVDLRDLTTERYEATSKDGTKVPYDVLRSKSAKEPGTGVLYGYGGFNIAVTPSYSARALMAATHGIVWAQAVLRGGSEFGEAWHQAGMKTKKQNVFDDYLAVAQDLVARKLVAPDRLVAMGGSNGGLLVSAAITQRPELFRAGVSMVPLTDMIRFPLLRLGKLWVSEYGDIAKEDEFKALLAYSPYHNVKKGAPYPAMLYTTAPNDTRVDPMHARKMVAALQAAAPPVKRTVLLRIDQEAGHGAGKPTEKLASELADIYAFVLAEAAPARSVGR